MNQIIGFIILLVCVVIANVTMVLRSIIKEKKIEHDKDCEIEKLRWKVYDLNRYKEIAQNFCPHSKTVHEIEPGFIGARETKERREYDRCILCGKILNEVIG